ncbi:MAG: sigma-70 family RNA polymerase sigma factor [Thermoleophilia bacterium]|nr:sigma-70 family RNA polymerase sigma factor [Thermoleophilia bacterium]
MVEDPAGRAFRRHYAQVFRYLRRRTESDEEAEDLAQAVFADAAEQLAHLRPGPPPVLAWLYTVAQRRLADRGRRAVRRPETIAPLEALRTEAVDEQTYGRAVADALRQAIAGLPPGQRQVVVMKLLEGRPFAEIARRVGASEAACKMRFARGLEALRTDLERRGVEP